MYKKILLICFITAASVVTRAQVTMTLQVPPSGVLVKNQLWNMMLVNSGNLAVLVQLNLVLLDERTNQPVMTGVTLPFSLTRGAKQIQAKDLGPIQYTYSGPAFHADQDPNGFLPAGSYQACYTLMRAEKGGIPVAENCIQLNVDPLSPPLLNTPADESSVYTPYPQFTWLPPTPPGLFGDLSYDLILVEVLAGQGKADAIEQNIPVFNAGFVKNLYLNYPSSYRSLDTGRLYAWRIVALNNGLPAAMTDIWTFRVVVPEKPDRERDPSAFVDLRRGPDASIASSGPVLRLAYDNEPADSVVHYTIKSVEEPGNPIVQEGSIPLTKGRNLVELPLSKRKGYAKDRVYLFTIINGRNEVWTVKFTRSLAK